MTDGPPKDYSKMDQELSPPLPPIRIVAQKQQNSYWSDGSMSVPRHRESGVDMAVLMRRLEPLATAGIAEDSLREHFSGVFEPPTQIKVVINYVDDKEVYIINVPQNTAKVVKNRAPKRGNHRYFFEHTDGAYEEMMGDTKVPIHQKDHGSKCIRCKVFNS